MLLAAVLVVAVLLAIAVRLALTSRPGRDAPLRPHRNSFRPGDAQPPRRKRAAVIVNPTKFEDLSPVRASLNGIAAALDWDPPLILETTKDDPGRGQTAQALAAGVDLVCPLGGDGTVRVVGTALAGTSTPLGLLPGGTGNLLARNLDLPVTDLAEAFRVACTGRNRAVDVGYVELAPDSPAPNHDAPAPDASAHDAAANDAPDHGAPAGIAPHAPAERAQAALPAEGDPAAARALAPDAAEDAGGQPAHHAFLVMAGVGLDATIMSETTEDAKARMGWSAYAATGFRNFLGDRIKAKVAIDGGEQTPVHARTVLIGNCGKITGGINLMPDARPDDGILDVVVISPKGFPGWVSVSARVLAKQRSARTNRLQRHTGTTVTITTEKPQAVQLDGDVVGKTTRLTARIEPRSLLVRVATRGETPVA